MWVIAIGCSEFFITLKLVAVKVVFLLKLCAIQ
jgi:hypothetical protein